MSQDALYHCWKLMQAPFTCRPTIMAGACLHFRRDGTMVAVDTYNGTEGHYTVTFDTDTSGTITIVYDGWTQSGGFMWGSPEEAKEAYLVKQFMHALLDHPIPFRLQDRQLCVIHDDKAYVFGIVAR